MHCWYLLAEAINVRNTVKYRVNSQLINLVKRNKPFFLRKRELVYRSVAKYRKTKTKQNKTKKKNQKKLGQNGVHVGNYHNNDGAKISLNMILRTAGFFFYPENYFLIKIRQQTHENKNPTFRTNLLYIFRLSFV